MIGDAPRGGRRRRQLVVTVVALARWPAYIIDMRNLIHNYLTSYTRVFNKSYIHFLSGFILSYIATKH